MVLNRALAAGGGTGGGTGGSTTGGTGGIELLGNPGFENGSSKPAPWAATTGVISNSSSEPAHSGQWDAWLDGYGTKTADTLYQTITLPTSSAAVTLSFWLHIDTDETTTSQINDSLKVQVLSTTGKILATLATYSNLDAASGYVQKSFDLSAYRGQKIKIKFTGSEDICQCISALLLCNDVRSDWHSFGNRAFMLVERDVRSNAGARHALLSRPR